MEIYGFLPCDPNPIHSLSASFFSSSKDVLHKWKISALSTQYVKRIQNERKPQHCPNPTPMATNLRARNKAKAIDKFHLPLQMTQGLEMKPRQCPNPPQGLARNKATTLSKSNP